MAYPSLDSLRKQAKKLDDGLVDEELRLYDFTALLVQVGVLRAKPGH